MSGSLDSVTNRHAQSAVSCHLEKHNPECPMVLSLDAPSASRVAQVVLTLHTGVLVVDSDCMQVTYSLELAQQYMWAQTDQHIFLATHVPTG